MGTIFVAVSKTLQSWGNDVGLGKNLYKVGFAQDGTAEEALAGDPAAMTDWQVLATAEAEGPLDALLAKLGRKEKLVDPTYYPRLRGSTGLVKANIVAVENSMLVAIALDNRTPPKNFKVKPVDIAAHLIRGATG